MLTCACRHTLTNTHMHMKAHIGIHIERELKEVTRVDEYKEMGKEREGNQQNPIVLKIP